MGSSRRIEEAEAVADPEAELLAIDAGERGRDIDRRMRNQRRVMIGEQRALLLQEVEQVGIRSRSEGTLGLSRWRWTLSN